MIASKFGCPASFRLCEVVNVIRLLRLLRFSWLVFLAVLTCAGQFEDVSVVLWVDRGVLWWFFTRFYVVAS